MRSTPRKRERLPDGLTLYRVFPWVRGASKGRPGHPLYVRPPQGSGRVDNPERYLVLYASDDPMGAVAEAFGNHSIWTRQLLEGPSALTRSTRALARYEATGAEILDLDDCAALSPRALKPSVVVTRDRRTTQAWALAIHAEDRWAGIRWWSYYRPEWGSYGIWAVEDLNVLETIALEDDLDLVRRTAFDIVRVWEG
jgi:RES domain